MNVIAKGWLFCLRSILKPFEPDPYNNGGGIACTSKKISFY
jgi:hypothetical protein